VEKEEAGEKIIGEQGNSRSLGAQDMHQVDVEVEVPQHDDHVITIAAPAHTHSCYTSAMLLEQEHRLTRNTVVLHHSLHRDVKYLHPPYDTILHPTIHTTRRRR